MTRLLRQAQGGDAAATGELFSLVYEQLKQLAAQRMSGERTGHTLQSTALVHEVYLRLLENDRVRWSGRGHFFFAAAEAMRRILVDHARVRSGQKRGGGRKRVPLANVLEMASQEDSAQILALDEALFRLEKVSADVAAIVRLRFYAGLSVNETAEALGISPRTVKREWTYARAFLARELG